jgi:hypothetical protein
VAEDDQDSESSKDFIVVCDECFCGWHGACYDPPLLSKPDSPLWFCADCTRVGAAEAAAADAADAGSPGGGAPAGRRSRPRASDGDGERSGRQLLRRARLESAAASGAAGAVSVSVCDGRSPSRSSSVEAAAAGRPPLGYAPRAEVAKTVMRGAAKSRLQACGSGGSDHLGHGRASAAGTGSDQIGEGGFGGGWDNGGLRHGHGFGGALGRVLRDGHEAGSSDSDSKKSLSRGGSGCIFGDEVGGGGAHDYRATVKEEGPQEKETASAVLLAAAVGEGSAARAVGGRSPKADPEMAAVRADAAAAVTAPATAAAARAASAPAAAAAAAPVLAARASARAAPVVTASPELAVAAATPALSLSSEAVSHAEGLQEPGILSASKARRKRRRMETAAAPEGDVVDLLEEEPDRGEVGAAAASERGGGGGVAAESSPPPIPATAAEEKAATGGAAAAAATMAAVAAAGSGADGERGLGGGLLEGEGCAGGVILVGVRLGGGSAEPMHLVTGRECEGRRDGGESRTGAVRSADIALLRREALRTALSAAKAAGRLRAAEERAAAAEAEEMEAVAAGAERAVNAAHEIVRGLALAVLAAAPSSSSLSVGSGAGAGEADLDAGKRRVLQLAAAAAAARLNATIARAKADEKAAALQLADEKEEQARLECGPK